MYSHAYYLLQSEVPGNRAHPDGIGGLLMQR